MTQRTDVSIEYKVAAMEAELRGGEVSLNGATLYVGERKYADAIVPFNHRTPEGREWFCEQLKIAVAPSDRGVWLVAVSDGEDYRAFYEHESRSRAIELAIEAEAEKRWVARSRTEVL